MKVLTLTGTRPELIRLSIIMKKLDTLCEHVHVFTNQNFDPNLSDVFFDDLDIREPNYVFKETHTIGQFLSEGFIRFEHILLEQKPDKILTLGDTNSGLLTILATKYDIPVYHLEAGNRAFDRELPEEINRRIIDAHSLYNLPYTENSRDNLLREGYSKNYVFKVGNPIYEVLEYYKDKMVYTDGGHVLATFHRANNVDHTDKLLNVFTALTHIGQDISVFLSLHPRTKDQLHKRDYEISPKINIMEDMGFYKFISLEKTAKCVITDSGTVPEECAIFHVPCVIIREFIERQELIDNGSVIVCGTNMGDIIRAYKTAISLPPRWQDLPDYFNPNVSDTVIRLLLGR